MEFDIGEHCALEGCNQLDFLPFKCDLCKKTYCLKHRSYEGHKCKEYEKQQKISIVKCPICKKKFTVKYNDDPNSIIEERR